MKQRTVLYAEEGKVLTNGKEYGTVIYLAEGVRAYTYHEITQEEYEQLLAQEEEKSLAGIV